MTKTWAPVYKIKPGSSGGFLAPPGHPTLTHHLEGFETARHRNTFFHGSIMHALEPNFDGPAHITAAVRRMVDDAAFTCDELWLRSVYAHFRNCYLPESGSRSASDVIVHNPTQIVVDRAGEALGRMGDARRAEVKERGAAAEAGQAVPAMPDGWNIKNYRRGVTPLYGRRRGYEITGAPDGSKVYVYALADDGTRYSAGHLAEYIEALDNDARFADAQILAHPEDTMLDRIVATVVDPPQPMDPERHSAVAVVREYFPNHEPRLDLIANVKPTAGLCEKCGNKVQYEGKLRKLAIVSTTVAGYGATQCHYNTECTDGGDHVR